MYAKSPVAHTIQGRTQELLVDDVDDFVLMTDRFMVPQRHGDTPIHYR